MVITRHFEKAFLIASLSPEKESPPRTSHETCLPTSGDSPRNDFGNLEAQAQCTRTWDQQASLQSKLLYLAAHLLLNLALTLSNKAVLGQADYPWLLTSVHALSTSVGCFLLFGRGALSINHLRFYEDLPLLAFSCLFTLNIAISNVSLAAVSVPFHQMMRSTGPIATIAIYRIFYGRTCSSTTYLSIVPIIFGLAIATAGDYYCTLTGFTLTSLGVILSAIKSVATNQLMTGSTALSALEVLLRMSPLATSQCLLYAFFTGELSRFYAAYADGLLSNTLGTALLANALIAFALNVTSFQTNRVAGALTMTVCGNVKQVLTIGLGILLFDVEMGWMNAAGIALTIAGALWYSKVELGVKNTRLQRADEAKSGSLVSVSVGSLPV